MKKVIILIVGLIILFCGGIFGGKLVADRANKSNNSTNKQITLNTTSVPQQKVDNNTINGFDLGLLTKDQFHQAESLGEKYKSRNIFANNINAILYSSEHFKNTYVSRISILTPYAQVVSESAELAKNYKDINDNTLIEQLKETNTNLNMIFCFATVGGEEVDFAKEDNIVIIIHNQDGTQKTIQPIKMSNDIKNESTTNFLPDNPICKNTISGKFDISGLTNIKSVDVKIIQPNMPEVSQNFDWNQINQL